MLKKMIAGAIAAGALSVPFAGIASADRPDNPGDNGRDNAPGQVVKDLREIADDQGYQNLPDLLRDRSDYRSPGAVVSDIARGDLTPDEVDEFLGDLADDDQE